MTATLIVSLTVASVTTRPRLRARSPTGRPGPTLGKPVRLLHEGLEAEDHRVVVGRPVRTGGVEVGRVVVVPAVLHGHRLTGVDVPVVGPGRHPQAVVVDEDVVQRTGEPAE